MADFPEVFLPRIGACLIMDSNGNRIAVKYYDQALATQEAQEQFEKNLIRKTARANAKTDPEIIMLETFTAVYRYISDVQFYIVGSSQENELFLLDTLTTLTDSVVSILRGQVDKRMTLENLDLVFIALDELCDNGIVLETESAALAARVTGRSSEAETPISEQTFSEAAWSIRSKITKSLLN